MGHPLQALYLRNLLGCILDGAGRPIDEAKIKVAGATVNPMCRQLALRLIRTNVPMIALFHCLAESRKIPIFSTYVAAGMPLRAGVRLSGCKVGDHSLGDDRSRR